MRNIDKNFNNSKIIDDIKWLNPLDEDVTFYGFNYLKEERKYYRFRQIDLDYFKDNLPNIYKLAKNTSGGQLHFETNTKNLYVKVKVSGVGYISSMSLVGQAGFDVYVGKSYNNLLFYDSVKISPFKEEYESYLFKNQNNDHKLVVINFPLYANVDELEIGIDKASYIKKPQVDLRKDGRIVYYGTSITQGGCASRPGMAYANILSRELKCEILNFGFSGNAFGEAKIAEILSEIDNTKMYIIDYEANGGTNGKLELTLKNFIDIIRKVKPFVTIVIISRVKYLFDELNPQLGKRREEIRLFQENLVKEYQKEDHHIYYINGSKLLGKKYDEYTVDSIHPNDLGFSVLAKNLKKELKNIAGKK